MDTIESLRCVYRIIDSLKRVLARHCFDNMRMLLNETAADFAKCYSDTTGDWIADNGTEAIWFRSQIMAQTYAALQNSASASNQQYRAAYVPLPPSDNE